WLQARRALALAEPTLPSLLSDPAERQQADLIVSRVRSLVRDWQIPLVALSKRDIAAGRALFRTGQAQRRTDEIERLIKGFEREQNALRADTGRQAAAATDRLAVVSISCAVFLALLGTAIGAFVLWRIVRPIRRLARATRTIDASLAETGQIGETRVQASGADELTDLASAFNDLADRVEVEQADLREAIDTRDAIFRASPLPIATRDLAGRLISFNPAAAELFGWGPELIGVRPEPDPDVFDELLARVTASGEEEHAEFTWVDREGQGRELQAAAAPIRNVNGTLAAVVVIGADVTEERRHQQQLSELMELFAKVFENGPEGLGLVSAEAEVNERRWLKVNPAMCRLFGYSEAELLAIRPVDMLHPEDRDRTLQQVEELLSGEQESYGQNVRRMLRKDGESVWVSGNASLVRGQRGEPLYLVVQYTDVTELERSNRDLRALSERLQKRLEHSPIAEALVDLGGRFREVNPMLERQLGYRRDELVGMSHRDLTHPDDLPILDRLHEQFEDGEVEAGRVEIRRIRADGHELTLLLTASVLHDDDGRPVSYITQTLDLSGQKERERQQRALDANLHEAQRLESLGVLAGGIAHDFNNLLGAVLLGSELLLGRTTDEHDRLVLAQIRSAGTRAAELSREMLAYSGRGRFVVESISLNQVIRDLTEIVRAAMPKKAELELALDPELPSFAGDSAQIHQVVLNLITNAAEALEGDRGRITITTGRVDADASYLDQFEPTLLSCGPYVYIEVSDTGCGIEQANLGRIFDPFFTTKFTGRGLGLAAVLASFAATTEASRSTASPAAAPASS
ncbi:MAG: PAS domain S-box protein, partial [Gaiellaceae bacterium]